MKIWRQLSTWWFVVRYGPAAGDPYVCPFCLRNGSYLMRGMIHHVEPDHPIGSATMVCRKPDCGREYVWRRKQ